jgi:glycosyltransferase involved in cell wall biosynthesis
MTGHRILHVLPHAGAGAQTYIDVLAALDGFAFEIFELSASRSPAAAAASIATRQPALVRAARRVDLVHFHGEIAGLISLPLLTTRPSVLTLHGLHLLRRLVPGIPQRIGRVSLRAIVTAADHTICVSQAERDELQWLPERLRAKLVVVRNGLPMPPRAIGGTRARARTALGLADNAIAVLYLGQLESRKDPLTVMRAVHRAHREDARIELLVAGEGPCAAELQALAGAEVQLLGQRGDVTDLMAAADVFVMASLREGLSYAVLEALGHGVATVVSNAPGNPEAVGDAGVVFPAGDEARLAAVLLELASDPERRAALATAGRERVATELSAEQMLRGTRAVYESILKAPARRVAEAHA